MFADRDDSGAEEDDEAMVEVKGASGAKGDAEAMVEVKGASDRVRRGVRGFHAGNAESCEAIGT